MSRLYCGRRGKSGSKKPKELKTPTWVDYKAEEVEALITKLRKQGMGAAAIGLTLRDQYGIPSVQTITGKALGQILKEKKLDSKLPEDLFNVLKQTVGIQEHLLKNKKDKSARHKLMLAESKVRRIGKYYSRVGVLPNDWKYDASKAKLLVQ
jgi:small subunit ribosomal protein S15